MNLQRQYEASHPVLHRRDYLASPQPSNNALCSFESIHNSEAILWPPETLHYDNRYGQAKETCSIMKVKDNLNHHFLNLISDDGLFSSRYDKKYFYFVNVSQPTEEISEPLPGTGTKGSLVCRGCVSTDKELCREQLSFAYK